MSLSFTLIIFRGKFKSNIKGNNGIKQNIKDCFESTQIQNCNKDGWSSWIRDNEVYNKKIRYNFKRIQSKVYLQLTITEPLINTIAIK